MDRRGEWSDRVLNQFVEQRAAYGQAVEHIAQRQEPLRLVRNRLRSVVLLGRQLDDGRLGHGLDPLRNFGQPMRQPYPIIARDPSPEQSE